ncbi:GNAT family N-acetyltransferase [Sphaerisporangium sp. TRM90804]|uniref:GNAT family N-acetyltransferase n=1 Tax=Sphaerisporangium sp. TRM90804 TaxID=3031113 RepID=UPI00244C2171|nr:GNAT family N-acetyltransferase [Sphaerisporangium sp. TRM90804]MDH2429759.1 GNAT family N-acetyltransferase [Sphaerisporangium sp. TRM90804]
MNAESASPAGFVLRPIDESQWPQWLALDDEAFGDDTSEIRGERIKAMTEFDRAIGAFDGDLLVGSVAGLSFSMTVPGGPRPVCGVSAVGVMPSHTRRGILSSLMRRQLTDLHEGGEAVAALYASESSIYGRFGYGRAADTLAFKIATRGARFVKDAPADPSLRLRIVRPSAARADLQKVFDAVLPTRPGLYARTPERWDSVLADEEAVRFGGSSLRCVIAEDDAGARAYALFRITSSFTEHDLPDGELRVFELFGLDPAAYALVWRHLLDRDLCSRVVTHSRPVDDPIVHLLAESRLLTSSWFDELWGRVVDVDRAMPLRAYSAPVDVVIDVKDDFCPWNTGRWRLSADASGAVCARTTDPADVALPVSVLGAAYFGGRSLGAYEAAGVVREIRPGSLRALSAAMRWEHEPWGGRIF